MYLAVDGTGGKDRERVYCNAVVATDSLPGTGGTQCGIGLFFSEDLGRTFSEPLLQRVRLANLPHTTRGTSNSVVLSNGTLVILYHVLFMEDPKRPLDSPSVIGVERSTDGGRSLEPVQPRTTPFAPGERTVRDKCIAISQMGFNKLLDAGHPWIAVDPSKGSSRDRLYVVWSAYDGTISRIMLSVSADKGLKWSEPVAINDGADAEAAGDHRGAFYAGGRSQQGRGGRRLLVRHP